MKENHYKTYQENKTYLFEVYGYKFRRLSCYPGEDGTEWSLYSMAKSDFHPYLFILVRVINEKVDIRYYYQGNISDEATYAANIFCGVYLKLIYPWINDNE